MDDINNTITPLENNHKFVGQYFQALLFIEREMEDCISTFFYEPPNPPKFGGLSQDDKHNNNIYKVLYFCIFNNERFSFSDKYRAMCFIFRLTNPDFWDKNDRFLKMIENLMQLRNLLAHNNADYNKDDIILNKARVKFKASDNPKSSIENKKELKGEDLSITITNKNQDNLILQAYITVYVLQEYKKHNSLTKYQYTSESSDLSMNKIVNHWFKRYEYLNNVGIWEVNLPK